MYKFSKIEILELLKQAHQLGVKLCDCEHDLENDEEQLEKIEKLFQEWLEKE